MHNRKLWKHNGGRSSSVPVCHSELTSSGSIEMKEETVSEFGKLQVQVDSSFISTGRVTFTDYVLIQSATFSASEMVFLRNGELYLIFRFSRE